MRYHAMGHSQGKTYDWRQALARMTDAPETSWRSSCPPQQAFSVPGFHNNKMDNRKQNFHGDSARASRRHFMVSNHCRVVRSIQSQVYCGRMHSVETDSLILSTNRNVSPRSQVSITRSTTEERDLDSL
jgi:hypothetical protein